MVSESDVVTEDYEHCDFGRTYGWWVYLDGSRVASLEYRCFLREPVHLYAVTVITDEFYELDLDPEKWKSARVVIQSRYAMEYGQQGLEMAAVGKNMIVAQNLYLPEKYYRAKFDEVVALQEELVNRASKNEKGREIILGGSVELVDDNNHPNETQDLLTKNPDSLAEGV